MEVRLFGPLRTGVPVIGQGTWDIENADHATAVEALRLGLDLGMKHIDTAEMYGGGRAEQIVAEAIAGRRDEVFLVSKVLPQNASRSGTVGSCEASLRRLRTDRLDCYLLHWRGHYPLQETIEALEELQRAGKIRSWGVSNFDVADLEEAWQIAGPGRIVCNQVLYHLKERAIEDAVVPWCAEHGIAVVAYSPLGHRDFPGPRTAEGKLLEEIARTHRATARQVALQFLVRYPGVFAIPKASTPEHARQNAAAGALRLSREELDQIDRAFPPAPGGRPLPML